jgi:hypothetical protein
MGAEVLTIPKIRNSTFLVKVKEMFCGVFSQLKRQANLLSFCLTKPTRSESSSKLAAILVGSSSFCY